MLETYFYFQAACSGTSEVTCIFIILEVLYMHVYVLYGLMRIASFITFTHGNFSV